jgi:hypothetical protein
MSTIFFLLKFCENQMYASEFVAGRLWLNPLSMFKEAERGIDGRGDSDEGLEAWFQPRKIRLFVAGHLIDSKDMVEPVKASFNRCEMINLLCLYAGTFGSASTFKELEAQLLIPDACYAMGTTAVLVRNVTEFQNRFRGAVRKAGFGQKDKLVEYFDPTRFHGRLKHPVFLKREEYSWQREYRFAVDQGLDVPKPLELNVGPLSDICEIVDPKTLNQGMRLLPPAIPGE